MTTDHQSIDLVRAYDRLDKRDPRAIVRFFETNRELIYQFDEGFYFNMLWNYAEALFSAMLFDRYLRVCDEILERLTTEHHEAFPFRESFRHVLHRKVECLYAAHNYPKAVYVCRELLKMDPADLLAKRYLKSILVQTRQSGTRRMQAAGIIIYLLGIVVIIGEIILIENFFEQQQHIIRWIRYGLLGLAFLTLISSEVIHRILVVQRLRKIIGDCRKYAYRRKHRKDEVHVYS